MSQWQKQELGGKEGGRDRRWTLRAEEPDGAAENIKERLKVPGWLWGYGEGDKMKMFFHLSRQTGPDTIGRVTEILIGAVGLKEFVPGISFSSVSIEDLAALEASPSSSKFLTPSSILSPYFPSSFLTLALFFSTTLGLEEAQKELV